MPTVTEFGESVRVCLKGFKDDAIVASVENSERIWFVLTHRDFDEDIEFLPKQGQKGSEDSCEAGEREFNHGADAIGGGF